MVTFVSIIYFCYQLRDWLYKFYRQDLELKLYMYIVLFSHIIKCCFLSNEHQTYSLLAKTAYMYVNIIQKVLMLNYLYSCVHTDSCVISHHWFVVFSLDDNKFSNRSKWSACF